VGRNIDREWLYCQGDARCVVWRDKHIRIHKLSAKSSETVHLLFKGSDVGQALCLSK